MTTTYTISGLDSEQVAVIRNALDIYARLGLGQLKGALGALPLTDLNDRNWQDYHYDVDTVCHIMSKHCKGGINIVNSSFGISSPEVNPKHIIAFDVHDVIRNHLAWEHAVEQGWTDGRTRDWQNMMQVSYDSPMNWSGRPLPKIKTVKRGKQ